MFAVEFIFLILLGGFLVGMQTSLSVNEQKNNTKAKLEKMREAVREGSSAKEQTTASFDEIYKGKADSLSFMFQNNVLSGYTTANMQEAKELLEVDNVLVIDKEGNILSKAESTKADFTLSRYNQLREAIRTGEASDGFNVTTGKKELRYYGSPIDENTMAVLEQNTEELNHLISRTSSWESMLSHITVGMEGYTFAVSAKDYTFLYYPDESFVGKDAISAGISVEELEDENYGWLEVDGEKLYCGVTTIGDAYVICAVSEDEIIASRNTTVGGILFAFFIVLTLVITYTLFMKRKKEEEENVALSGKLYYNKTIGSKIGVVSIFGLLCILLVSFYMQTLFSLSRQSMSNSQCVQEIEKDIKKLENEKERATEFYDAIYLNKAKIAAYITEKSPEIATRENLAELASILNVGSIYVFDESGTLTATNTSFTNFSLSQDPEGQSYEFNKLLLGMEYLIQEAQPDEISGEYQQYIGTAMYDDDGHVKGFTQITVTPERLEEILADMKIETIMSNFKVGKGGVLFAVDKESNKIVYHPNSKLIGKDSEGAGIKKGQLTDGYVGYMTVGGSKYYASSVETKGYYLYAAVLGSAVSGNRLPITLATGIASFAALLILFLLLTVNRGKEDVGDGEEDRIDDVNVDVSMPDGRKKKTTSAASRWSNERIHWNDKTAEQQLFVMLRWLLGFLAVVICVAVLMKDTFFDSSSIFLYILSGKWSKGFNIFAFTGSILIICIASVLTMIIQKVLTVLSRISGAKGETVCRMLHSFVKYFSCVAILYYCLSLFGVDTKTLLASAGILTLVIGLGAQTLVSDILAGLFIIFEGEFQVGDIVTIGDYRGTVVEIGIRTTKIQDGSKNVKIISNSDVCGVINMTRDYSYSWADVGIEYGESIERVEAVLEKEFPNIRAHLPNIIEGPFYKGVVALGDNSVNIRVMVLCAEADRIQMERDLNREMKLIFDKHNINVPFPQIVINQPVQFQEATEWEKYRAGEFRKAQNELAGALIEDEEEEHR